MPPASKGSLRRRGKDVEEDEKEAAESAGSAFAGTNFSDLVAMVAGAVLLVLMLAMFLLLYINMMGDIRYWEPAKLGQLDVYNLGTIHDTPSPASRKDKDDLLETYQAVDAIERAVQHGNIAGARGILAQLIAGNTLQETDVAALTKLIDEAEAENPIAELGKCRAPGAFTFVKDKGGKIISQPAGGGAGEEIALMMADFDHDQQHADGRGRGIAALKEVKEGEILLEVPPAAHMSVKSAESTPGIDKVFKAESAANGGVLRSFNGLALFLLHQTHKVDSAFREYICSLPLHIPLPFLWNDADLPEEFLADDKVVQDRLNARELVELSYNITVPAMLEKYPDVFQAEELTTSKWSWACSVIMSRALPFKKSGGMLGSSFSLGDNLVDFDPVTLLEGFKTASQPDSALHTLIPVVDMINHESSEKLGCGLSVKSDGTVLITAGPSGLSRGYEVAVSYSDKLCGTKPLNRFGFVLPPCPGDEGADPSTSSSE